MATDFKQERLTETFKSLVTLSVEGFRYLALINGGAVVTLLAYLGNVTKNGLPMPNLQCALLFFLLGLAACGVAMVYAYFTQLRLLNDFNTEATTDNEKHPKMLKGALLAFGVSLASFCIGAVVGVHAFSQASWEPHAEEKLKNCPANLSRPAEWGVSAQALITRQTLFPRLCDPLGFEFVTPLPHSTP